ncbi:MAG: hypothetical protein HY714_04190 [Candidatus Omnitrophica bacterium]|nr:hypothetical protein [Candidatus Omnitrophota bacterium]
MPAAPSARNFEKLAAGTEGNLLALAERGLYSTQDGGRKWASLFQVPAGGRLRNSFLQHPARWFVLSSDGLFSSSDRGKIWTRQSVSSGRGSPNGYCMAAHPGDADVLALGTQDGLYWSLDRGKSWAKQAGRLDRRSIRAIAFHPRVPSLMFAVSDRDIYRSVDWGRSFSTVFHLPAAGPEPNDSPDIGEPEEEAGSGAAFIQALEIHPLRDEIWAGTASGVFFSTDLGQRWQPAPSAGLGPVRIADLVISEEGLIFAAASDGVYCLDRSQARWVRMQPGLLVSAVRSLRLARVDGRQSLFALTQDQIFRWPEPWPVEEVRWGAPSADETRLDHYRRLLEREPPLAELHRAAIRYSDTSNAKIKRWHFLSRLRSLVPGLSLDKNLSVNSSVDIDRGATNTPDYYIQGPETRDRDLNLSLDWNLADLIWGSYQTSIDSREKLMVELRNDLLSEVTRLYFERRRLMMELAMSPPALEKERMDLVLRIEEVTGYLDALTGGYFAGRDFRSSASLN